MNVILLPLLPVTDRVAAFLPLRFSISGSTTISCSSYDSGGVVVAGTLGARGLASSTTITVALVHDGAAAVAGSSRDRIAL